MGKKPKGRKGRRGRRRPSEVIDAGPLTIEHFGRVVITRGKNLGDREQFFAEAPRKRQKLKDEIDSDVRGLAKALQDYDALALATATLIAHGTFADDDWSEVTSKGNEAAIDLVHSLLLAVSSMGTARVKPELAESFTETVAEVIEKVKTYYMFEFAERKLPDWKYELRFPLLLRFLFHRGPSYEHHHRQLIRTVFGPHDDWLRKNIGASLDEILAGVDDAEAQLVRNVRGSVLKELRVRSLHQEFREYVLKREAEGVPFPKIVAEWRARPEVRDKIRLMSEQAPASILEVKPDAVDASLFDRLSASPLENREFLEFEKSPGWPTNDSCIYTRPLVKIDKQYLNVNPTLVERRLDRVLESWIEQDAEYTGTFSDVRGRVLEELAVEYLAGLLPSASIYRNLFYDSIEDGVLKRREVDALIAFDRTLFIVEAKSSGISHSAWRGGFDRLEANLREITIKAADQLRAARDFIASSPVANFTDAQGDSALSLERDAFTRTFLVNVTLESLGFLTTQPLSLKGLLGGNVDLTMWSVFVNDLRVISEVLELGSELIAFLEARLRAAASGRAMVVDELDYLMMYLYEGPSLTPGDWKDTDRFMPNAYTYDLDRFYAAEQGKIESAGKPRSKRPAEITRLVKEIEASAQPRFTDVCVLLLNMDASSAARIGREFREIVNRFRTTRRETACSVNSKELGVGVTLVIRDSWSAETIDAFRSGAKREDRTARWLTIFLGWAEDTPQFHTFTEEKIDDSA